MEFKIKPKWVKWTYTTDPNPYQQRWYKDANGKEWHGYCWDGEPKFYLTRGQ